MTSTTSAPSILMISAAETPDKISMIDQFAHALAGQLRNYGVKWATYRDVGMTVLDGQLRAFLIADDRSVTDFSAVYFKSYGSYFEQAVALAEILEAAGVPFGGKELLHNVPEHKLSQMTRLAVAGLPQPDTLYLPMEHYLGRFDHIRQLLGVPFIFKAIDGKKGKDNYLVSDEKALADLVSEHAERHFIAQKFIPNDGDLRLVIVRQKIQLIMKRQRTSEATHLNNTSTGATAQLVPIETFDEGLAGISLRAAESMQRDITGVDLLVERSTNKPYILEVNASPQLASGAFVAEKLAIVADYVTKLVESKE